MTRREACAPFLVLLAAPLLVHWPAWTGFLSPNPLYWISGLTRTVWMPQGILPGYPYIDANAGVTTQALGVLAARDWLHGTVPWWNPYTGIGLPLAGEMQPAPFFLPFLFLLLVPGGVLPLKTVLMATAGIATFALLRQLRVGTAAALSGALLFEFNGCFAWLSHGPILPVAFLPLLLLGIERAADAAEAGRPLGWSWITVALAYSLLAGFPEVAYLDGLMGGVWAVWRLTRIGPGARAAFARKLAWGGLLALLLAAPQLVAFADFLSQGDTGGHAGFSHWGLVPPDLAMLLVPYVAGTVGGHVFWFYIGGYIGAAVLLLALLSLARRGDGRPRLLLGAWLALTFAKAAGVPGIVWLLNLVPLVHETRFSNYIAPSWSMAAALLAAFAIDDWRGGATRRVVPATLATLLLAAIAVAFGWHAIAEVWAADATAYVLGLAALAWSGATVLILAVLLRLAPTPTRRATLAGLLAVDTLVAFSIPLLAGIPRQPLDLETVAFLRARLGLQRFAGAGVFLPNYGAMFETASVNYNYLPNDLAWAHHVARALDPAADPVNFQGHVDAVRGRLDAYENDGVKYVVVPRDADPKLGTRVFRGRFLDTFELPHPAPYFDASDTACRLEPEERTALTMECPTPTRLLRRELFMAGWTATIDGTPRDLSRAGLFQALDVPAGRHEIRFSFRPPFMPGAEIGCALAALAFGVALVRSAAGTRRRSPERDEARPAR